MSFQNKQVDFEVKKKRFKQLAATLPNFYMDNKDKEIAEKIAKKSGITISKLGLRFDKVAVRLLNNIRNAINKDIPDGKIVLLAITAPIKLPQKTELEIYEQISDLIITNKQQTSRKFTVFQNKIHIRTIDVSITQAERFVGFVHNTEVDSMQLFDKTTDWLKNK